MKTLLEYKWQLLALGCLVFVITSARGGAQVLMPLVRWILPLIVIVFILGYLKKKIMSGRIAEAFRKQMEQAMQAQQQKSGGGGRGGNASNKTIDLCPKCGSYSSPGHKCKVKKT